MVELALLSFFAANMVLRFLWLGPKLFFKGRSTIAVCVYFCCHCTCNNSPHDLRWEYDFPLIYYHSFLYIVYHNHCNDY